MPLDEGKKKLLYISYFGGISFNVTHAHKCGYTHTRIYFIKNTLKYLNYTYLTQELTISQ